ncbi:MAG: type II toxin-antitoxin system VapB family antitoxin [Chloroflexota bacterium]
MGLNIKNAETEALIRELAGKLNVSLTAAVTDAVQARLDGLARSEEDTKAEAQRILEMWGELGDRLGKEYMSQDFDALLYDERGLPK